MRTRDSFDVLMSLSAGVADAVAVYAGFMLAVWIRFYSGWIPLFRNIHPPMKPYFMGAAVSTVLFLVIFRSLGMYVRPQAGRFENKIPRIIRAIGVGILFSMTLPFLLRTDFSFSRTSLGLSFFTISFLVLLERYLLFRYELHLYKYRKKKNRILVIGIDDVAVRVQRAFEKDPRLCSRIVAFLKQDDETPSPDLNSELLAGTLKDLGGMLEAGKVDQVVLAHPSLPHHLMASIIVECERALVDFYLVPDVYDVLTSRLAMTEIDEVPLLGVKKLPLDYFWRRLFKRVEDVFGASFGLLIFSPLMLVVAILIKRESPGPVFYRQVRCGERGHEFTMYKLRTMIHRDNAENEQKWTVQNDPRRTRIGSFLRRYNLDELPQFWNVLKGDMSLVGPRPEQPLFVEEFRDGIQRYMWRHAFKPGMTGYAQINGLRGDTSIEERLKYDLYYLENWSLSFDFKILAKTVFAHENAY